MAKFKKLLVALGLAPLSALATDPTYTSPPGLSDAISTAQTTAQGLAGDIVPAAVVILFAFAGLFGVYLIWKVFRKGASGR